MKLALIADIHANDIALQAICQDLLQEAPDQVFCLGDVVGYGANPNECCAIVRERKWSCIAGNWDWAVARPEWESGAFNPRAEQSRWWTRGALQADHRDWLASLPTELVLDELNIHLAHSCPGEDTLRPYIMDAEQVADSLLQTTSQSVFVGHTHCAAAFVEEDGRINPAAVDKPLVIGDRRAFLNVGAAGQPRDGDPRASYVLYDTELGQVRWQRVAYDTELAAQRIRRAGLPDLLAERLMLGK